jgi:transcriptional regulator with XRE-family HTH domain
MEAKFIAYKLITLRKRRGLSQRGAAKLLGVTPTQLMEWENGKRMPEGKNLLRLCALFNVLIEDVYYELRQEAIQEIEENTRKYGAFGTGKPP